MTKALSGRYVIAELLKVAGYDIKELGAVTGVTIHADYDDTVSVEIRTRGNRDALDKREQQAELLAIMAASNPNS